MIEAQLGQIPLLGFVGNPEISHSSLYAYEGGLEFFA
jgi:hypothetical protein